LVVIDDAVLLDVLAGLASDEILEALQGNDVFTTGCWYYRLSRAVHSDRVGGSLSRHLGGLDVDRQVRVVAALDRLPDSIGLLSLRDLVPVMRALRVSRPLNLLNAEALAAALVLDAALVVSTDSPLLREAAAELGVEYSLRSR
jgi:hypothetical protein